MAAIIVSNLHKSFLLPKPHVSKSIVTNIYRYLFPVYENTQSLNGVSFSINKGEKVALIGPNGAGKSTTIKILTGIMLQSHGKVKVLGKDPFIQRQSLSKDIGVVFGHCSALWPHLPVESSFNMLAAIYNLETKTYHQNLTKLVAKLEIENLIDKPVNKLSLGQKMRCEIVASLLHNPKLIMLDEPTIGLDITAKANLRDTILDLAKQNNSTLLLTSHDTSDIEQICERVIIMDKGKVVLDSPISTLKKNYTKNVLISIITDEKIANWTYPGTKVIKSSPHNLTLCVDLQKVSKEKVSFELLNKYSIKDISFENPTLETIIKDLYASYE